MRRVIIPLAVLLAFPLLLAACGKTTQCTSQTSGSGQALGAYTYTDITMSNGFNTYADNNGVNVEDISETLCASSDANGAYNKNASMTVTATTHSDAGGAVQTYPNLQQQIADYDTSTKTFGSGTSPVPVADLTSLTSSFTETMPTTITAEAAYDIWPSNNTGSEGSADLMIWNQVTATRGTGGAQVIGHATVDGHAITVLKNGQEHMLSFDTPDTSDTLNLLDFINVARYIGAWAGPNLGIGQLDYGWEICDTMGVQANLSLTNYSITATT